eukprot:5305517-Alexandrium_andersonii.AAC.1
MPPLPAGAPLLPSPSMGHPSPTTLSSLPMLATGYSFTPRVPGGGRGGSTLPPMTLRPGPFAVGVSSSLPTRATC